MEPCDYLSFIHSPPCSEKGLRLSAHLQLVQHGAGTLFYTWSGHCNHYYITQGGVDYRFYKKRGGGISTRLDADQICLVVATVIFS